jgi:cyclophilin family peptidyl-prolyl cis-trans isomerase
VPSKKRERKKQGRQARQEYLRAQQRRATRQRRVFAGFGIVVVIALVAAVFGTGGRGKDQVSTGDSTTTVAARTPPTAKPVAAGQQLRGPTPCPQADGSSQRTDRFSGPPPLCLDPAKSYVARFDTTEGLIEAALDTRSAPLTTNNFVVLSRYHYYDGSALFRTNTSIAIIQGGGPHEQSNGDAGPGYTIKDEGDASTRRYAPGDLVMARTQQPDSAGAQFFFAAGPQVSQLDAGNGPGAGTYVTFGKVTQGLDVLERILALHQPTARQPDEGAPRKLVVVRKIEIVER